MAELVERLRRWAAADGARLPLPGAGQTALRHRLLAATGCQDLALARLAEAHTDALAILAEAGRTPHPGALYGVWAAEGPHNRITAVERPNGGWQLDGTKHYCSGAAFLTRALLTAQGPAGGLLFDVPLNVDGLRLLPSTWATPALAETATLPVALQAVGVGADSRVGAENWYLERPGFWHGAVGPAACWAGGAQSLIDAAITLDRRDAHARAQLGALRAIAWEFEAILDRAGRDIDADPGDAAGQARRRALMVRHLIERGCTETLDRFGRATGPQLLCFDSRVAQQHMALAVYIRQCHAERDLEAL